MRKRVLIWVGMAVVTAGAGLFHFRTGVPAALSVFGRPGAARSHEATRRAMQELLRSARPRPGALSRFEDDSEGDAPSSDEQIEAALEPFRAAPFRERWENESGDATWALEFEENVRALFSRAPLPNARLLDVDCRQTLCRIEVGFDSPEAFRSLLQVYSERAPLAGSKGRSDVEPNRVVTYLAPAIPASPG
jgi:hypothetical protein